MSTITVVTHQSARLDEVKALWKRNKKTLGFYPKGAFDERARKRQILGAFERDCLVGYLLYYIDKDSRVRITHLCVAKEHRRSGIARELIAELKSSTKSCQGIGLHCREDYVESSFWPKVGFHAWSEKVGSNRSPQL